MSINVAFRSIVLCNRYSKSVARSASARTRPPMRWIAAARKSSSNFTITTTGLATTDIITLSRSVFKPVSSIESLCPLEFLPSEFSIVALSPKNNKSYSHTILSTFSEKSSSPRMLRQKLLRNSLGIQINYKLLLQTIISSNNPPLAISCAQVPVKRSFI